FFSSRRRHTRFSRDWSSDVCSSDLVVTPVTWASKELKTYAQVELAPGETRTVEIELPVAACTIVDAHERRIVDPGEFALLVGPRSEEHTSELQSRENLVCRLLLEKT